MRVGDRIVIMADTKQVPASGTDEIPWYKLPDTS